MNVHEVLLISSELELMDNSQSQSLTRCQRFDTGQIQLFVVFQVLQERRNPHSDFTLQLKCIPCNNFRENGDDPRKVTVLLSHDDWVVADLTG